MKRILMLFLLVFAVSFSCRIGNQKESVLYTFDLTRLSNKSAKVRGPALVFSPASNDEVIPLPVEQVPWHRARFLVIDAYHKDLHSDILWVHFYDAENPEKPRISAKIGILPQLKTRLAVPLDYLDGQTFFMARRPRQLKGTIPGNRLPQDCIGKVTIALEPATSDYAADLIIERIFLTTEEPKPLPKEKPIVDRFGQWKLRDWPVKTRDERQLSEDLTALVKATDNAQFPDDWSSYGGWKGKRFTGTGFFRVVKDDRWWLVDPEGYAFFSVGMDVSVPSSFGPVSGMEDLFEWLPDSTSIYKPALGGRGGQLAASFLTANWIRVFGSDWEQKWRQTTRGLLVQCRFNTIGNWSDMGLIKSAKLPYVWPLRGFPSTRVLLYRDFPDVFSPEYKEASEKFARQILDFKDDPFLIGYFLDNEPLWAFGQNNIASEMLATTTISESRKQLVAWLRSRYSGDVSRFSSAWQRPFSSFEELLSTAILDAAKLSPQAEKDLWEFSALMVDEYLRLPCEALRRLDPHHLNLGIRYAWISSDLCYVGGKYFDVFSINSYTERPDPATVAEIARRSGRPVMIGEFHHGAIDRGLPSTGIRGVVSQAERGVAYRYYVEQAAAQPDLVGVHYFQLNDQPILGRFDGENYNIGLVDICNRPYPELMEAMTRTNEAIYEIVSGARRPTDQLPRLIPAIFF
ncbi:MAG: hypothetical protein ONB12_07755 [candidate division KSB1 bacterium]|nr:hypothetical protein [candidate division KSB1 bacterium]